MLDIHRRTPAIRLTRRPRLGGGTRTFARLGAHDARAWHRLGDAVARCTEPRLAMGVVASRVRFDAGRWRLESLDEALDRARQEDRRITGLALHTDVESFYDSVTPGVLEDALLGAGVDGRSARDAAGMLAGWRAAGCPGLPVGPPASAVMANAVLLGVDELLAARPFVRWVDDYRIAVASTRDAAGLLGRLDAALGARGLRRSERKTVLGAASDLRFPGSASGNAG